MESNKEPIWTQKHLDESAEKLYEMFSKAIDQDPQIGFSMILREFCILQCTVLQLQEAFKENHKVSSGAFKNSHIAVEKFQQLEGSYRTSTSSFSKRLETLEGYEK